MRIRLAKVDDVEQLAHVHWVCSADLPDSFMFKIGKRFLREYYRVLLEEKNSVVVCAEDTDGQVVGMASGSLDATEHVIALRRNRFRLLFAALPSLIQNPGLIVSVYSRQQSMSADREKSRYIVLSGARGEFWAWLPTVRSAGGAIVLFRKWLSLMRLLGAREIRFEVDKDNERVAKMHRLLGAHVVEEFVTPDGKPRLVMEYPFET